MTEREKLKDLIKHKSCFHEERIGKCAQCSNVGLDDGDIDILTDYLLANGVIVLPCKVGSTIYRIDEMSKHCSHEGEYYDEYYCRKCRHLLNGDCDSRKEPYIKEIKNANAQTILGNEHLIGTRVFLTREEAEKALAERSTS